MATSNKPTKDEEAGLKRHLKQVTIFLSEPERIEDAYRAGFRDGRAIEAKKMDQLVKKIAGKK